MEMFVVHESRYSFEDTVLVLSDRVLDVGWRISAILDLQDTLLRNDIEILPITVFELCNPAYAAPMLTHDELRMYSPMMPCRISVYQTSDGKVCISRLNSGALAIQVGGMTKEIMTKAFDDIEEVIKGVI